MANRTPLVQAAGLIQQLQAADVLANASGVQYVLATATANMVTAASAFSGSGNVVLTGGANRTVSGSTIVGANIVTATSVFADHAVLRSDGAGRVAQTSGVTIDDAGVMTMTAVPVITIGSGNSAVGAGAPFGVLTTGTNNTGFGASVFAALTSGERNVALGNSALEALTIGVQNVALGRDAGNSITIGNSNMCVGYDSGSALVDGSGNMCVGTFAGNTLTSATNNAFVGTSTGLGITTGSDNVCIGASAGGGLAAAATRNTVIGREAGNTSSTSQTSAVNDCIIIGRRAFATASRQCVLGSTTLDTTFLFGNVNLEAAHTITLGVFNDAGRPAAGTAGRVIFNTTDGNLNIDDGTNWILPDGTIT